MDTTRVRTGVLPDAKPTICRRIKDEHMLSIADLARAQQRVFPTHARVERYYPAAAAEEARATLTRCLDRGEGPALLIGAAGTGKSMLLQVLADDLGKQRPVVCLTSAQLCTRRALLQSILFELGQSYRQRDEGELRLTLNDYLSSGDVAQTGVLLLVDEAQTLPTRLLEELRVLGNLAHRGVPTVRLLLAGSQALEEKFTEPEIEVFNQRIVARCYLAPFNHYDTSQFVRGHIAAAGGAPDDLVTSDALDAVYHATNGIARLINQVCDRALLMAARHGQMRITKEIVQGAWADLQQLPTPWNLPDVPEVMDSEEDGSEVVEFGPLSDDRATGEREAKTEEWRLASAQHQSAARVYDPADDEDRDVVEKQKASGGDGEQTDGSSRSSADAFDPKSTNFHGFRELPPTHDEVVARESPKGSAVDDFFGGDDFEEEVVIEGYASFENTVPSSRPRVTNNSEAEISELLHDVMQSGGSYDSDAPASPAAATDSAPRTGAVYPGLSVVDVEFHDSDEGPLDGTELDEEPEHVLTEIAALSGEADHVTSSVTTDERSAGDSHRGSDEAEIVVVEDDSIDTKSAASAHRADYRQLFKTLRHD